MIHKQHCSSLQYDQHTEGGWTLEQHWSSEITLEKIRKGGWDVVVLQVRYLPKKPHILLKLRFGQPSSITAARVCSNFTVIKNQT